MILEEVMYQEMFRMRHKKVSDFSMIIFKDSCQVHQV